MAQEIKKNTTDYKEVFNELEKRGIDINALFLQRVLGNDGMSNRGISRGWILSGIIAVSVFAITTLVGSILFAKTMTDMYHTYISQTEKIIKTNSEIESANAWESLPINQRKERLRQQYYKIVSYYNSTTPDSQRMSEAQILESFNTLWLCCERVPSINFFLPMAYMKVATNFNPVYDKEYKRGIAAFYLKNAESLANLPLVVHDPIFQTVFQGVKTVNNPSEAIKLLVARFDDLSKTFQGREDWIFLAMFTNEYEVIARYWQDGKGVIPDEFYQKGNVAEALMYYNQFRNWQIPNTLPID